MSRSDEWQNAGVRCPLALLNKVEVSLDASLTDEIMVDFTDWLGTFVQDPLVFIIIFFIFAILATVILPIPVEIGLFIGMAILPDPVMSMLVLAIVLGVGKGMGSLFVFEVGAKLEPKIRSWSDRWNFFAKFVRVSEAFVAKYRYYAIYVLLSIPLMLDTVPLYLFSLLNKEGKAMDMKWFGITNFLAGLTRAAISGTLFFVFGIVAFG